MTDTLVSAFRSLDPEREGRTITVAEVLEPAAKELPEQLKNQPVTLASLLNAVGSSFGALGLFREAVPILETTRNLRLVHLGPDHLDTLISQNNLASAYQDAGRLAEAISLNEQVLKASKTKLGPDHPDTLGSQNGLAEAYRAAGRFYRSDRTP